jgi:hypothetical protein
MRDKIKLMEQEMIKKSEEEEKKNNAALDQKADDYKNR